MKRTALLVLAAGLMLGPAGCAVGPFGERAQEVSDIGPAGVVGRPSAIGERVVWGGVITGVVNHAEYTEIEVAALPLDARDRPRIERETGARFLLRVAGFADPVIHAPQRPLSVLGTITGVRERTIGEQPVSLPVLEAEAVHLWTDDEMNRHPRWTIGIGIRL